METLSIKTKSREHLVDITDEIQTLIAHKGWLSGALLLHCPHTTAAVTINEHADPSVGRDIVVNLGKLIPRTGDYRHMEGNSDAHIKASLVGPDQLLIVEDGSLRLGTWQGVFFCEFDGPRSRKLWAQWLPA